MQTPSSALSTPARHLYPKSHWPLLAPFVVGDRWDPKHVFLLSADRWEVWRYAAESRRRDKGIYCFRFGTMRTFLQPYVKRYIYLKIIGSGVVRGSHFPLPYELKAAEDFLIANGIEALDGLADSSVFLAMWESMRRPDADGSPDSRSSAGHQERTRPFFAHLHREFSVPSDPPPTVIYRRRGTAEIAADSTQLIPPAVSRQLVMLLRQHREGSAVLDNHDHLRLCVLVVALALGLRAGEVLGIPRGSGDNGPLTTTDAKDGGTDLWCDYFPEKRGRRIPALVGRSWEDIGRYCISELMRYGDEVRDLAAPDEADCLILVSPVNGTFADRHNRLKWRTEFRTREQLGEEAVARGLGYNTFWSWLSGGTPSMAAMRRLGITVDGEADGEPYHLKLHQFRHTRSTQGAISNEVRHLALQRDLNHTSRDMHLQYQHGLSHLVRDLSEKEASGQLLGRGVEWMRVMRGSRDGDAGFAAGTPGAADLRFQLALSKNPGILQVNRVPCGYCTLPQGPTACPEMLKCLSAEEDGCAWFVTDPTDPDQLNELRERLNRTEREVLDATRSGRKVAADRLAIEASRMRSMLRRAEEMVQQASTAQR